MGLQYLSWLIKIVNGKIAKIMHALNVNLMIVLNACHALLHILLFQISRVKIATNAADHAKVSMLTNVPLVRQDGKLERIHTVSLFVVILNVERALVRIVSIVVCVFRVYLLMRENA